MPVGDGVELARVGENARGEVTVVTQAIRTRKAMFLLHALMMLVLRGVVLLVLVVVEQVRHPAAGTIQPGIVPLLIVLGVHAHRG